MIAAIVLLPALVALCVWLIGRQRFSKTALIMTSVVHLVLVTRLWFIPAKPMFNSWFQLDSLGLIFLTILSFLFLNASFYCLGYLRRKEEPRAGRTDRFFIGCLLFFLSTMTLVTVCQHFEMIWVAIEATTLASAPLIYFHRNRGSIEATWKYLIICSVGIAVALLGNFFLSVSISTAVADGGEKWSMLTSDLLRIAPNIAGDSARWLKISFVFLFVGYGTKMGLAPLHTWLPDAHSEAPAPVSALLSGALLNCAFLGILRALQVCIAAGLGDFAKALIVGFGVFSVCISAVFLARQNDFKRMLAYSSVEHMGILSIGTALGGSAIFGSLLHAVNHSLTKAMLFFSAGNIYTFYRTRSSSLVRGMLKDLPFTGTLWFIGLFAITGLPPFGLFTSKFTILKVAFEQGKYLLAGVILFLLAVVFVGMSAVFLRMILGEASDEGQSVSRSANRESFYTALPPLLLVIISLVLGLFIPNVLLSKLRDAAQLLGGG